MMAFFQWVKQLVHASHEVPDSTTMHAVSPTEENSRSQQRIVSQQDVYHHNRPVLLLKSGQWVKPKTLASLHNQGVPVVKYCALQEPDGSLLPLDHTTLRRVLAQHDYNEQFSTLAMNRMLDLQARRGHGTYPEDQNPDEPQAWQRHFKVLMISNSVALQEKVRHILEQASVLPQQIRPVMHLEAFMYSYDKYRPTCLIFDEATYRQFCHQGFDLIQFIQGIGGDCVESMVCVSMDSYLAPSLSLEGITYQVVIQPLHRQSLMAAIDPVIASIKRTYSNTVGQTMPVAPLNISVSLESKGEENLNTRPSVL
jgi:hypothetical protein